MKQNTKKTPLVYRSVDEVARSLSYKIVSFLSSGFHSVLRNLFAGWEAMVISYSQLLPKTRTSNPFSKLLRPVLGHKRLKAVLGVNLAGVMMLASAVSVTPSSAETFPDLEVTVIDEDQIVAVTEERFSSPVILIGISQGFHGYHKGVDLRAKLGSKIGPIAKGKVAEVVRARFGYGNYVVVKHENDFSSLYAHMGKVFVKPGDEVETSSKLGEVGLTGWTTGSHLHLEVYENDRAVNPRQIVSFN